MKFKVVKIKLWRIVLSFLFAFEAKYLSYFSCFRVS